jgi:hypothetical protein
MAFVFQINAIRPSISTWRSALGTDWMRRLQAIVGFEGSHSAYNAAIAGAHISRRRLVLLQHYAHQKRNARSARLARAIERAKKEVREEDAALDTLLAWCQAELDKSKKMP